MVRTSPFRDKDRLIAAIEQSSSVAEVLTSLGLRAAGGNYRAFREACEAFEIPKPNYKRDVSYLAQRNRLPDDAVFVVNSTYKNRADIKKRLYSLGVAEQCSACGVGAVWNGKPLTLTLEHINGIWNDNRKENLTILCPNCHSQTETFAGRQLRKQNDKRCACGAQILKVSERCSACSNKLRERIVWPTSAQLADLVEKYGYSGAGRHLGVSDVAVRKRLKNH